MSGANVKKVLKYARDICDGFYWCDKKGNQIEFEISRGRKVIFGSPDFKERNIQLFKKVTMSYFLLFTILKTILF